MLLHIKGREEELAFELAPKIDLLWKTCVRKLIVLIGVEVMVAEKKRSS